MLPPLNIPAILNQHQLKPDKRLGQNFLVEESALQKVIQAADISPNDVILEIGPGLGSLTRHLAIRARYVVAVELDQRLFPVLQQILSPFPNICLLQGDILQQNQAELIGTSAYLVVANIPYYITSAVIRHLLEPELKPRRIVLTVQIEVAKRICAGPGELSLLALSVQIYGQPIIATTIPAGAFYPPPKVDSAVIVIDTFSQPRIPAPLLTAFFQLIKAGFSQKRKTLRNALAGGLAWSPSRVSALLEISRIDPQRRAETITIQEWERLALAYSTQNP
jgi:16S rRNA (adenine1518-N6/adenine1519-N6)-dimethyltransferase